MFFRCHLECIFKCRELALHLGVHLEEWYSMQGLLPHTDEITAHPAVYDPLLGDHGKVPVHLHQSHIRKVPVNKGKGAQRNESKNGTGLELGAEEKKRKQ